MVATYSRENAVIAMGCLPHKRIFSSHKWWFKPENTAAFPNALRFFRQRRKTGVDGTDRTGVLAGNRLEGGPTWQPLARRGR